MFKRVSALLIAGLLFVSVPCAAAPSTWAEKEVEAAIQLGIVPEHLQNEYQTPITREGFCEIAMSIWSKLTKQTLPAAENVFTDTENPAVIAARELGIVKGVSETEFAPQNPITRQEISVMLKNTLSVARPEIVFSNERPANFPDAALIADWAMDAVQNMHLFAVMLGDEMGNVNPLGNTTREQAILLGYRLIMTQAITTQEYIEKNFMPLNSNTQENMYGGAFVGCTADRAQFYVGADGIYQLGKEEPVVKGKADTLVVFKEAIYFIGEDGGVYMMNRADNAVTKLVNDKTDSYSAYNGYIYYRNLSDGGKIYRLKLETMTTEAVTDRAGELPVISGEGVFFSDGAAIYKLNDDGTSTRVFEGANKNLCVKDKKLCFLSVNGLICKADLNGANYSVVSRKVLKNFHITRECYIGLSEDGGVYKIDFDGKYAIKLDGGTYQGTVTYDDYVFARDAEGNIYKFSNNGTEKAKIN